MARIFDVMITSGTSHSLYTIYYDQVGPSNIATIVSTTSPATGVTYSELIVSPGVRVEVPETATRILLYNDSCLIDDEIILPTPTPSPSPTPSSTPTPTPTPTPNCDFDVDVVVTTPTPTPSATPTATPTPSPSSTPTPTPTPSPTTSPTPTPSSTPTPTPTPTPNCDFGVVVDINQAPTGFTPLILAQNEGTATGTTITTFSAQDPDGSDTHTFSLVSGVGSTDNASFTLSSSGVLKNDIIFDRETKSSYSIRVRVTDQGGLTFEDTRIVTVTDVNETPYGLTLSNDEINENQPTGTTIGTFTGLDIDDGETFTYALTGTGNDNGSFTLTSAGVLKSDEVFNYEVKNSYTIEVTVTDSGNNTYTDTFTISVLDVNETPTDIGLSNSSIDENVATGTTIGTFSSTDPDASNTFTYTLVSGFGDTNNSSFLIDNGVLKSKQVFDYETKSSYTIRVRSTDQGGLFFEKQITITITNIVVSGTVSVVNALCNGDNGTITVTSQTGGDSPYQYSIDGTNYQTSTVFTKPAGIYTVYVKDSNNEVGTIPATITQPSVLNISIQDYTLPTCNGDSDGSITVSASGGNGSYLYKLNNQSYQPLNTFTGLGNGTYTITIKDDNECTGTTITTLNKSAVESSLSVTGVTCNGGSNGRVSFGTPFGGNGPTYQYKWNNGDWVTFNSTVTFTNLTAGTYPFLVKDVSGCTTTYSAVVSQPSAVNVIVSSSTAPTCYDGTDGSVTLSASGGTGTKLFSLNGVNYFSSGTFTGLSAGSYTGYAKDSNNCVDTVSFSLTKSSPTATVSNTNIACYGGTGTITVSNPTGGSGGGTFSNYDVKLDGGDWISFSSTSYQFTNVSGGLHSISIRDNSNCVSNAIIVFISEPSELIASGNGTAPTCDGGSNGSITWSRTGGTSPFTYTVNGSAITNLTQTGLTEGTYTFVVTDNNNCTDSAVVTLSKSAVVASYSVTNSSCGDPDGSVTLNSISGGNGGTYQYRWFGSDWINFTGPVVLGELLFPSTYSLEVRDSLQCTRSYSVVVSEPTPITFTTSKSNPTCWNGTNGSITVSASGGNGVYQYSKNGGLTWQTSNVFNSLANGNYPIQVKDSVPCYSSTITVLLSKTSPSATITTGNVSCYQGADGTITLSNPTGGYGGVAQNYQHKLNSGTYVNFQSTSYVYTNKEAGSYTVWIKDFSGCERSYTAIIGSPSQLTATITDYVSGENGSITVTSGGGTWNKTYRLYRDTTSPYTVGGGTLVATISNVTSGNPSQTFTGLAAGFYYVIVTDANGCTAATEIQSTVFTEVGNTGFCRNTFVDNSVDINRYGLRWNHPTNGQTNQTFSQMLATPYTYSGTQGSLYGVCSTLSPSVWDSQTNSLVIISGVSFLQDGLECTSDFDCMDQL